MVVEHGQWMAAAVVEQRRGALEIHLPQGVGRDVIEALPSVLAGRGGWIKQVGAAQDAGDGTGRQSRTTLLNQQPRKLASAPRIARLMPQLDDALCYLVNCAGRTVARSPRAIAQAAQPTAA
jgi:hypothetical protein